jgi:hypothetical protein
MNTAAAQEEFQLLERVARYQKDYRTERATAIKQERERRHEEGAVYVAGCWVPREEAARVDLGMRRHERLVLFELGIFLALLCLFVFLLWVVFGFLLLP